MIILKLDDGNQCKLVQTYSAESASPQLRALKPPRYRSAPTCWSLRSVRTLKNSYPLSSSNVCCEAARAIFKMRTNVKAPKRSNKISAMSLRRLLGRLSCCVGKYPFLSFLQVCGWLALPRLVPFSETGSPSQRSADGPTVSWDSGLTQQPITMLRGRQRD